MGLIVEIFHFSYWSLVSLTAYCMIYDWWALALQLILSMNKNKVLRTTNHNVLLGFDFAFCCLSRRIYLGDLNFFFLAMAGKVGKVGNFTYLPAPPGAPRGHGDHTDMANGNYIIGTHPSSFVGRGLPLTHTAIPPLQDKKKKKTPQKLLLCVLSARVPLILQFVFASSLLLS